MSVTAVDWALCQNLSAPRNLLLVALAWVADDSGATFKSQETIAARLGKDPRWVREHMPKLAAEGYVSRFRRHRINGSRTTDLIVLNMPRTEPFDASDYSGIVGELEPGDRDPTGGNPPVDLPAETRGPTGGFPPPPNQPLSKPPTGGRNARASARDTSQPPEDFPEEMLPHLRGVYRVLRQVAEQHHAKEVTPLALGHVLASRQRKPVVKAAHDLAAWAADSRTLRDVVATYRNWLDNPRVPTLATLEPVDDRGYPVDPRAVPGSPGAGLRVVGGTKASRQAESISTMREMAKHLKEQGQ